MKTIINFPPPCQPCRPPCLFRLLTVTACIQANTRGMLIMPAHDISKISPPILSKQLSIRCTCHPLHLAVWPIQQRGMLFSVREGGILVHPSPLNLFVLGGDVISVPTGQTDNRELCYSLSAADDRKRNMRAFVPRVAQGQGEPKGTERDLCLILGVVCIIFNFTFNCWG